MAQRYGYHDGGHPFYISETDDGVEINDMVDTNRWVVMPIEVFREMVEDWGEEFQRPYRNEETE